MKFVEINPYIFENDDLLMLFYQITFQKKRRENQKLTLNGWNS